MKFLILIYGMKLFLQTIISLILNLIESYFHIFLGYRKINLIDFLFHFLPYLLKSFLIRALANQLPNHPYLRHLTTI